MKRKLINFDVFERIQKDSLSTAEAELKGAQPILAETLGVGNIALHCYGPENVLYETSDGTFIHANYTIKNEAVSFENVEQLVIDEESEKVKSKEILGTVLDSLLDEEQKGKADSLFADYLNLPATKRIFREGCCKKAKKNKKFVETNSRNEMLEFAIQQSKGAVKEWSVLCKNAIDYVEFKKNGPVLGDTQVKHDENGNVVALRVPTTESANQKKLLQLQWDHMLDTDCQTKRWAAKGLSEDAQFCKAVNDLRRQNALSDATALEEALENVVSNWPNVLYLTQTELAQQIKVALETVHATNYDDQVCDFMAEGILRTAQEVYTDRVEKIVKLAGTKMCEECDQYLAFQEIVSKFFPTVDENVQRELAVYADLYETLRKIYEASNENLVKVTTAGHLNELASVLQREVEPSVQVVEEAVEWLMHLIETNLAGGPWSVSNKPHQTVVGDHPAMAQKAKQGYTPASDFSGDWGDSAPVSDGKSYRGGLADEMRNRSWSNWGNGETYPELKNPYIPKPFGDYTGTEKGVDKASDATSQWSSSDTWPALQNPYVPKAETPDSYKMNGGKEEDLVVDK
ncbi:MAG: hypothetical protein M0R80_08460 [Proteobacteria bacterium]|jgi:hypothetical protein|nr:hypothetical protein [Pseudomonadota bacterium]